MTRAAIAPNMATVRVTGRMSMNESECVSLEIVEIRHRMANCFQLLASLTRTRTATCDSPEARRTLRRVAEQIQAISHLQTVLGRGKRHGLVDHLREMQPLWSRIDEDRGIEV